MTPDAPKSTDTRRTAGEHELEPIAVELDDGSVYRLDDELRLRAFHVKYGETDPDAVLRAFRERVAEHWSNRTKPWKGLTLAWGEDPYAPLDETFEDQAELAAEVMYSSLRAPLLAMVMQDLGDVEYDRGDAPSVIGLWSDGVFEYRGDEAVQHDSVEDVFGDPEE